MGSGLTFAFSIKNELLSLNNFFSKVDALAYYFLDGANLIVRILQPHFGCLTDRFDIALFSALDLIHWALDASDTERVTEAFNMECCNIHQSGALATLSGCTWHGLSSFVV